MVTTIDGRIVPAMHDAPLTSRSRSRTVAGPSTETVETARLHDAVLSCYDASRRTLPWREPGAGPWAVLVSEFMLQQTPVARVLPAYEEWLARWPTPAALAA